MWFFLVGLLFIFLSFVGICGIVNALSTLNGNGIGAKLSILIYLFYPGVILFLVGMGMMIDAWLR